MAMYLLVINYNIIFEWATIRELTPTNRSQHQIGRKNPPCADLIDSDKTQTRRESKVPEIIPFGLTAANAMELDSLPEEPFG